MKKIVNLVIGEPWDFEVQGSNKLLGEILGFCFGPKVKNIRGKYLLIKLEKPFKWDDETVKELVATERSVGDSIDNIFQGNQVFSNIARVKPNVKIRVGGSFKIEAIEHEFIGTIEIIK